MIPESKLKADCTPEIIKKMVELAEGFESPIVTLVPLFTPDENDTWERLINLIFDWSRFPLLIHRAVEGFNKKQDEYHIITDHCSVMVYKRQPLKHKSRNIFSCYQPESLTHCECACLHCLIEVLK